jgi:hypothetical protein
LLLNELNKTGKGFPSVHTYCVGGDVLKKEYIDNLLKNGNVLNGYGPTESTVCATFYKCSGEETTDIPIGKPIANYKVYILDKDHHLVPIGVPGELCVGGPGVTRGYMNQPELTNYKFFDKALSYLLLALRKTERAKNTLRERNQPKVYQGIPGARNQKLRSNPLTLRAKSQEPRAKLYRTGDRARWLTDGNIEFLGRIDYQVKIRGYRIQLEEIEHRLLKHDAIKEAVVLVREDRGDDKYICAYIVTDRAGAFDDLSRDLKKYLSRYMPDYMVPSYFVPLENIPVTANGKIDKKALHNLKIESGADYVPPGTEMEKLLADTWKEILKVDKVGIHDNYFDIGGNSLNIIRINHKLKEALNREIPIVNMFRYPTIHSFLEYLHLEGIEDNETSADNEPGKETGSIENESDVVVIGISGRFPGARNTDEFWQNLKNGVESIAFFSPAESEKAGIQREILENPDYVGAQGILEEADYFDASFFDYTPMEAEVMDPQSRLFHECAWEALENAGYEPGSYSGLIGVYAGVSASIEWQALSFLTGRGKELGDFTVGTLANNHYLSTMVAYKLDLKGPANTIFTACSTSLVSMSKSAAMYTKKGWWNHWMVTAGLSM